MLTHIITARHVAQRLRLTPTLRPLLIVHTHPSPSRPFSTTPPHPRRHLVFEGRTTNDGTNESSTHTPFYLETGYSIFAKRPSRPFPPPFLSTPSHSFSDPLTTHKAARDRRPSIDTQYIRGITNGDDAVLVGGQTFLAVNDGVGAWAQKERGHAALWSRLIAHYWAVEVENAYTATKDPKLEDMNMIQFLQTAYEQTKDVTTRNSNEIVGTTTASSALLHHRTPDQPVVLATTLGDCATYIIRPSNQSLLYKSKEQWHWFDCPRQLGTNSLDTPNENAVMDMIDVAVDDIVCVVSDGVSDNLWEHEIVTNLSETFKAWREDKAEAKDGAVYMARELMAAAQEVAQDLNGESPYMERALDEGIAVGSGGKLDDISVVVGVCRKRE
jgi:serine/threonine protein phosphatase PrpC